MAVGAGTGGESRVRIPTWDAILLRPALIAGMVTCIVLSWVALARAVFPEWRGDYLVLMLAASSFVTLVSEQLTRQLLTSTDRLNVRVSEVALMLILLRFAMYLHRGTDALQSDFTLWLRMPSAFLVGEYLVAGATLLALWFLAIDIGSALFNLSAIYSGIQNRRDDLEYLADRFTVGAFFVLGPLGILHITSARATLAGPARISSLTWLPIVYLACGLLLFAQARLAILEATWQMTDVPASDSIRRRWGSWGLAFVLLVSLLALLFPALDTTTGFYLLLWISYVLSSVAEILFNVLRILLYPIWWLLTALLGEGAPATPRPEPQPLPTPPPPPPGAESGYSAFWLNLRLIVFWSVVLATLFVLLKNYLRNQGALAWWDKVWASLVDLVRSMLRQLRGATRIALSELLPGRQRAKQASTRAERGWWKRWHGRTSQERVRRIYLMMIERASRAGLPRTPDSSPYEYADRLEPHVGGEQEALHELTQAFVEARYSRRDFQEEEVGLARRLLIRVQRALFRPQKPPTTTPPASADEQTQGPDEGASSPA